MVEPDTYVVAKDGPRLLHARVGTQAFKIVRGPDGEDQRIELDPAEGGAPGARRRRGASTWPGSGWPSRRTTGHPRTPSGPWPAAGPTSCSPGRSPRSGCRRRPGARAELGALLVQGLAASAGRASGVVRVLQTPDEGQRLQAGEVLVAPMTSPDWVPDHAPGRGHRHRRRRHDLPRGHRLARARRPGRRRGPHRHDRAARRRARHRRRGPGHGHRGRRGRHGRRGARRPVPSQAGSGTGALATRIYVNLAFAEHAEEVAAMPVDGVGLLRAEFMVTDALGGVHPRRLLERGDEKTFVDEHGQVAAAHHAGVRAAARGVPEHRLPLQRVLATSRAATSSSPTRRTR